MTGPDEPERDPAGPAPTEPFVSPSGGQAAPSDPTVFPGGGRSDEPPPWGQATQRPPSAASEPHPHDPYRPPDPYAPPASHPAQPTYGGPGYGGPGYGAPGYGGPAFPGAFARAHGGATTSLVLGIIGCVAAVLCVCSYGLSAIVGVVCSAIAIWLGLKARREIDAAPGAYSNRGVAQAGFVTGIIGTALGAIVLAFVVVGIVVLVTTDNGYYY